MIRVTNIKRAVAGIMAVLAVMVQASCYYPKTSPGWEYMPDMSNAISYETYSVNDFYSDSMTSRKPVTGTIPRGRYQPFRYSANPTGYDSAGMFLKFPSWVDSNSLADGKYLFDIYCAVCHGTGGKANGPIVTSTQIKNPYPPPPSYFTDVLLNLPEGKMVYSVHYGKNLMGSYSKALDQDQVWKVIYYVKSMQKHYLDSVAAAGASATASADTTKK
jgi:mono/diheme cytochrome c family protein